MATEILVIGSGTCAAQTAQRLANQNIQVVLASQNTTLLCPDDLGHAISENPLIEQILDARLTGLNGAVGNFQAALTRAGLPEQRLISCIVVAEENDRSSNAALYGLTSDDRVLSVSRFRQMLTARPTELEGKTVVFLNGLAAESDAFVSGQVMSCALDLQQVTRAQGYFLTTNLKVAANGLEKRYRAAKSAGCLFFKFSKTTPAITRDPSGTTVIEFVDEVNGDAYTLQPDVIVVDESVLPSAYLKSLARLMQLDTDPAGFIQTENVHRLTVSTNRRGIFAAGPARALMAETDLSADAANAAAAVLTMEEGQHDAPLNRADIDMGQCIACLTCLRLCPYKAVLKGHRMAVLADACEGCGICAAECPRGAIAMGGLGGEVNHQIGLLAAEKKKPHVPAIMLFCCNRSAYRAGDLAVCLEYDLPEGLTTIVVPCAGAVSVQHLLAAFRGGVDGVMLLTCHEGNCHSENGNTYAHQRVDLLAGQLQHFGIDPQRLEIHTLASNMAREFSQLTLTFEAKLKEVLK